MFCTFTNVFNEGVFMKKTMLALLVCALFLGVSVAKAEYEAMHKLSIDVTSGSFYSDTNTFSITSDSDKTFSFKVGYEFVDPSVEQDLGDSNSAFPLEINFDKEIFTLVTNVLATQSLVPTFPQERDYGAYVPWNDMYGNLFGGSADLIELTFTLNDDISLDKLTSTEITFSLLPTYSLIEYFGLDAQPITVMIGEVPKTATPEPGTMALLSIALTTLPFVRRRFRASSN